MSEARTKLPDQRGILIAFLRWGKFSLNGKTRNARRIMPGARFRNENRERTVPKRRPGVSRQVLFPLKSFASGETTFCRSVMAVFRDLKSMELIFLSAS